MCVCLAQSKKKHQRGHLEDEKEHMEHSGKTPGRNFHKPSWPEAVGPVCQVVLDAELLEAHLALPKRKQKFTAWDLIYAQLNMRRAGVPRISKCGEISGDLLVSELAGIREFPCEHTLYDTLHLLGLGEQVFDEEGARRLSSLGNVHEGFVREFFQTSPRWKR